MCGSRLVAATCAGPLRMFSRTLREILERDLPNPNPKLRSRPAVGVQVLTHFKPENGAWTGGQVYDPEEGKSDDLWVRSHGRAYSYRRICDVQVRAAAAGYGALRRDLTPGVWSDKGVDRLRTRYHRNKRSQSKARRHLQYGHHFRRRRQRREERLNFHRIFPSRSLDQLDIGFVLPAPGANKVGQTPTTSSSLQGPQRRDQGQALLARSRLCDFRRSGCGERHVAAGKLKKDGDDFSIFAPRQDEVQGRGRRRDRGGREAQVTRRAG